MVLKMIYLVAETILKNLCEDVELVIVEFIHILHQAKFAICYLDSGRMLLLLEPILAPPVHVDWISLNLVRENKPAIFKVHSWLFHVETTTEKLIRVEPLWERIPLVKSSQEISLINFSGIFHQMVFNFTFLENFIDFRHKRTG